MGGKLSSNDITITIIITIITNNSNKPDIGARNRLPTDRPTARSATPLICNQKIPPLILTTNTTAHGIAPWNGTVAGQLAVERSASKTANFPTDSTTASLSLIHI